jgi:hypothetical protein
LQRLFTFHHAGTGSFTQFLNHTRGNTHSLIFLNLSSL